MVPILKQVLIYKVSQYLGMLGENIARIPNDQISSALSTALEVQAELGWDNFLKVRLSKQWKHVQQLYLHQAYPNSKINPASNWAKQLILSTWDIFQSAWSI
eukprot:1950608-Ditylum_brightwellii.AAC.1